MRRFDPSVTLAVSTAACGGQLLAELTLAARESSLDAVEVAACPPNPPEENALEARWLVQSVGLDVACYGARAGRDGALSEETLVRELDIAGALQARYLRVWADPGDLDPDACDRACEFLRLAGDLAAPRGLTVVVERCRDTCVDDAQSAIRLLSAVNRPNVKMNWKPLEGATEVELRRDAFELAELAPLIAYVHAKNFRQPAAVDEIAMEHAPLAEGVLDWGDILGTLFCCGFDGVVSIERVCDGPAPFGERLRQDALHLRQLLTAVRA